MRIAIQTMHENDIRLPTDVLTPCNFEERWRSFHGVVLVHRGSQQGTHQRHTVLDISNLLFPYKQGLLTQAWAMREETCQDHA
jgi:hypothetical protein